MPHDARLLPDLLPYLLQRASYLVTRQFHRHLQLNGVSVSRWRMLAWLSENQPYSVNQLAEQLMLRQPTVTKLIDDAVRDGLVKKTVDRTDARRIEVRLRAKGRRLAEDLKERARRAEADFIGSFGRARTDDVKNILRSLIDYAQSNDPEKALVEPRYRRR